MKTIFYEDIVPTYLEGIPTLLKAVTKKTVSSPHLPKVEFIKPNGDIVLLSVPW
jgi:hypothetical protein